MAMITAISNQKGGVGKTSTAQALACGLRKRGQRVLLVDLDPQSNLSFSMGADTTDGTPTIYECMKGKADPADVIQETDNGDIIPASLLLSAAELEFNRTGREHILEKLMAAVREKYDHIIIDTPPALNVLTENAYTAADQVIVTMEATAYSVQGVLQLFQMIENIKEFTNPELILAGILICRYKGQTTIAKDLRDQIGALASQLQTKAYATVIREGVTVTEAQAAMQNLQEYAPQSNPAIDYEAFVDEFLGK